MPSSRPSTFAHSARDSAGTAASSAAPTCSSSSKPAASLPPPISRGMSPPAPPAVGAAKLAPHSSRAAKAVTTIPLKPMPARAATLGAPAPPRTALWSAAASSGGFPPPTARCCAQRAGPRGICRCARTTGAPLAKQLPTEPPTTRPKRWCVPVRSGSHYGARTGRFAAKIAQNPMLRGLPTHKSDS